MRIGFNGRVLSSAEQTLVLSVFGCDWPRLLPELHFDKSLQGQAAMLVVLFWCYAARPASRPPLSSTITLFPAIGDCLSAQPARPRPLSHDSGRAGASVISCWHGASIPIPPLANCCSAS
jgi:hypothetical protein